MSSKKPLLVAAVASVIALGGGAGVVAAATNTGSDNGSTSLVDKIATKFNLNKTDVQKVFDEDRSSRQAEREADQASRLAAAVKAGKLTQAQADYITKAQAEIKALMGDAKPGEQSSEVREQVKTKMDTLRKWATDNKVDQQYVGPGVKGGPGGPDGPRGERQAQQ